MSNFDAEIKEIVDAMAQALFAVESRFLPGGAAPAAEDGKAPESLTGCVTISGGWNGAVTISCTHAVSRNAAATMFGLDHESVSLEDERDALGEMTNILGGNYKSLVASITESACQLSLPVVTDGAVMVLGHPNPREYWFALGGDVVCLRILENVERQRAGRTSLHGARG